MTHRTHLLAYVAFALSGVAQLLLAGACLHASGERMRAFRLASPAASAFASALLLAPPYATPAESMAHKTLAGALALAALAEGAAVVSNSFDARRRLTRGGASGSSGALHGADGSVISAASRTAAAASAPPATSLARGVSESAVAMFALACLQIVVGAFFLWTAVSYYADYAAFAASPAATAITYSEPLLVALAITLLVFAYVCAVAVVARCLATPCGCRGDDAIDDDGDGDELDTHSLDVAIAVRPADDATAAAEAVEAAAAAAAVAIGGDLDEDLGDMDTDRRRRLGESPAADSTSHASSSGAKRMGSRRPAAHSTAKTAPASLAAASHETIELTAVQSRIASLDPWGSTHARNQTAIADAPAVVATTKPKRSSQSAANPAETVAVPRRKSSAVVATASVSLVSLAPPPSDTAAAANQGAPSVPPSLSSSSLNGAEERDLWDMSAEELEAAKRVRQQRNDVDLI